MGPPAGGGGGGQGDPMDLVIGGGLQAVEAITLGLPFEVWKTRQGANPTENCVQSFKAVWAKGPRAFWAGWDAKVAEAALKGAVLLFAKEYILDLCELAGFRRGDALAGAIGGAGGGVMQTVVMSPLTYVVTYKVKNAAAKNMSALAILQQEGWSRAYGSSLPMALRQASNWALRQAFADGIQSSYHDWKGRDKKLSSLERIGCGIAGGIVACINQPFEVLRIRVQALHASGEHSATTASTARIIFKESGFLGFYVALVPRACLSAYQTVFMVTFASMAKEKITAWRKGNAVSAAAAKK